MKQETEATRLHREAAEAEAAFRARSSEIDDLARTAAREAEQRVRDNHRDELQALRKRYVDAATARDSFVSANASHPLEGRKVFRTIAPRRSWDKPTKELGVLEVRRQGTQFSENLRHYDRPDLGELFIRRVKADGSPGQKVVKVYGVNDESDFRAKPPGDYRGRWELEAPEKQEAGK